MRFRRLELGKFGSFTGEHLEFAARSPDFHVVFGPNEAGKSTTLRAIKGFLYGIPHVSRDVYLHGGGELRIGAELEREQETRRLTRRKGRKATLLDEAGEPVPEEQLKALLNGVDAEVYSALFGLDHVSLREGGAALARGEGQLGESLYAAGIGSGGVREVLSRLRAEGEALYLPRGKRTINQLVSAYQEAKQSLQLATTEPESWLRQREEVARQRTEVERLSARRSELRLEESRLKQLQRLGHIAGRFTAAQRELAALGDPLELPEGFQEERERWTLQQASGQREARRRSAELISLRQELASVGVAGALAEEFELAELEYLDDALGSHRKAVLDLPRRRGELQAIDTEVRQTLASLELTAGSEGLPGAAARAELGVLIEERARLEATLQAQRDELAELDARLGSLTGRCSSRPVRPSPAALEHAVEVATDALRLESRLSEVREQERQLARRVERSSIALAISDSATLVLPSRDRFDRFLKERRAAERELENCQEEVQRVGAERADVEQRRGALESSGEILRPEQLASARDQRELAWQRVDDELRAGKLPQPRVVREFEAALRQADRAADELLEDAERVSLAVQLSRSSALLGERLTAARERLQAAQRVLQSSAARLVEEYPAFAQGDPEDLVERFEALLDAREAGQRQRDLQHEAEALARDLNAIHASLEERLSEFAQPSGGESLRGLIRQAKAVLADLAREAADARADERRLAELSEQRSVRAELLIHAEKDYGAWADRWKRALGALNLPLETPSRLVTARLEAFTQLERRLDKRASLRGRIEGMERDALQLSEWLRERLERLAPDLVELEVTRAGAELKRRFHAERAKAERIAQLTEQIERVGRELLDSEQDVAEAERELRRLCQVARVGDPSELPSAERRAAEQARLRVAVAERQRELLEEGSGTWHDLGGILSAVREAAPAATALGLSQLESELNELDESYRDAISDLERKRAGLERLSTGSAATRREEKEEVLASLRREVVRYRRVKLAELILAQEVERYRKENQGPILERANQLFPGLTLGRYRELAVGFDADDRAILEAIPSGARDDHERVRVDDLSDGARDQLFLALRIASIERYVEAGTALPVVLDDVLVHFDEERARAALIALAELGERTQVLFFTHHRRHVELCEATLSGRFSLHELRRRPA